MQSNKQIIRIFVCGCILIYPMLVLLLSNLHTLETEQSLCPSKLLTGFPCPGCGITKSILFFYAGDFTKSIHYHIFGPMIVFICLLTIFIQLSELLSKKNFMIPTRVMKLSGYFIAISLGIYHFVRLTLFVADNTLSEIIRESIWR